MQPDNPGQPAEDLTLAAFAEYRFFAAAGLIPGQVPRCDVHSLSSSADKASPAAVKPPDEESQLGTQEESAWSPAHMRAPHGNEVES